jgi:hypothetical protein
MLRNNLRGGCVKRVFWDAERRATPTKKASAIGASWEMAGKQTIARTWQSYTRELKVCNVLYIPLTVGRFWSGKFVGQRCHIGVGFVQKSNRKLQH